MTTKMKNDTKFTQSEMLTALNNMKAPFSIKEQDYLESYIKRYEFFEYGQSDIESLILEILSGATDDLEMKTINYQKLITAIENRNPIAIALIDRLAASLDSLIDDIHEDDLDISETDATDYFNSLFE